MLHPIVVQKLRERAGNAPTSFRVIFEAFERIHVSRNPHLLLLPHWQEFTAAATMAGCFALSVCLAHEAPAEIRTELELVMRKHLESRWPGCESFWEDLTRFTSDGLLNIPRRERASYLFLLPSLWLANRMSDNDDFDSKDEFCAEVAMLLQQECVGYWSAVQDYSNN